MPTGSQRKTRKKAAASVNGCSIAEGKLLNSLLSAFSEPKPFSQGLDDILALLGTALSAARIHVFRKDGDEYSCTAEWCRPGLNKTIDGLQNFTSEPFASLLSSFAEGKAFHQSDSEASGRQSGFQFSRLKDASIKSIALAPIFKGRDLWGILDADNPSVASFAWIDDVLSAAAAVIGHAMIDEETAHLLRYDPITGLPMPDEANFRIAQRLKTSKPAKKYVLLRFDLQRASSSDYSFGAHQGDSLLKRFAAFLSTECDNVLIASRIPSTTTFYCLLDDDPATLERNVKDLALAFSGANGGVAFSGGYGAYVIDDPLESFSFIESKAAIAQEEARKDPSRNFVFFDKSLEDKAAFEQNVIDSFDAALAAKRFEAYIQPQFDLAAGTIIGGEVLCRWRKENDIYMPNSFIPVLERNGLISVLDRYMLAETLKILRRWIDHDYPVVPLSVNLSRLDFYDDKLLRDLISIIDNYHVPHEHIKFEITESAYIEQESRIVAFIENCRQAHIAVVMDDFGSGYSSLSSLKNLDISALKLDYRFLIGKGDVKKRNAIIYTVIGLCRNLSLPLIVEGIERKEDADFLLELGIRYVQGYYFGRPLPVAEFERLRLSPAPPSLPERIDSDLINELSDPESPANRIFNRSFVEYGVFSYEKGVLRPLLLNKSFAKSPSFREYGDKPISDAMEAVVPDDRKALREYIEAVIAAPDKEIPPSYVRVWVKDGYANVKFRATLLENRARAPVILLESVALSIVDGAHPGEHSLQTGEASFLFDNSVNDVFIISANMTILYRNESAKSDFPQASEGDSCQKIDLFPGDCDNCPIKTVGRKQRLFVKRYGRFIDLVSLAITYNGEPAYLVDVGTLRQAATMSASKIVRMNTTVQSLLSAFLEINLTTGQFQKYEFGRHSLPLGDSGDFKKAIDTLAASDFVTTETSQKLHDRLSLEALRQAAEKGESFEVLLQNGKGDSWINDSVAFFKEGEISYACVAVRDVSAEIRKDYDSLTHLYNRSAGQKAINDYLADNPGKRVGFFLADVDSLKDINDAYGHPFGDRVLVGLAEVMRSLPPPFAFGTRLGGDEFMFIYQDMPFGFDEQNAMAALQNGFAEVGARLTPSIQTSVSIGEAIFPRDGLTFDSLYAVADRKMYERKNKKD